MPGIMWTKCIRDVSMTWLHLISSLNSRLNTSNTNNIHKFGYYIQKNIKSHRNVCHCCLPFLRDPKQNFDPRGGILKLWGVFQYRCRFYHRRWCLELRQQNCRFFGRSMIRDFQWYPSRSDSFEDHLDEFSLRWHVWWVPREVVPLLQLFSMLFYQRWQQWQRWLWELPSQLRKWDKSTFQVPNDLRIEEQNKRPKKIEYQKLKESVFVLFSNRSLHSLVSETNSLNLTHTHTFLPLTTSAMFLALRPAYVHMNSSGSVLTNEIHK